MVRPSGAGRCVHCLRRVDKVTSDHVFPRSWYPKTTPEELERWQAPACLECNRRYGQLEDELRLRLGLCLDPKSDQSRGVWNASVRSLDPEEGRDKRDREQREKRRQKILRQLIPPDEVPAQSVLPGFGPHAGSAHREQLGLSVAVQDLKAFGEKIVRGITYVVDEKYIEDDYSIEIMSAAEIDVPSFRRFLTRFGVHYDRGPGISVTRAVPHDDLNTAMFEIEIWGRLNLWATVSPRH